MVNDSTALVSVLIPTYNVAAYLDQAITSARTQTHRNLEIICINDGSTDASLAIMQAHASQDERIVIIDKPNSGYGASLNRALELAHGEWIAILEPDDWLETDTYETMLSFASRFDTEIDMIKTPYWAITNPDTPQERKLNCVFRPEVRPHRNPCDLHDLACLLSGAHPSIWSALYRRSFLDEFDIHFLPIPGSGWADNPFFMKTLCCARTIAYLDKPLYYYRVEPREKTNAFRKNHPLIAFERWHQMLDIMEETEAAQDPNLLQAHYLRGFTYMGGVLEQHSLDEPEIRDACVKMFARMKYALIAEDPHVPPNVARLYYELTGNPSGPVHRMGYLACLIRKAVNEFHNNGAGMVLSDVKRLFRVYAVRGGRR